MHAIIDNSTHIGAAFVFCSQLKKKENIENTTYSITIGKNKKLLIKKRFLDLQSTSNEIR